MPSVVEPSAARAATAEPAAGKHTAIALAVLLAGCGFAALSYAWLEGGEASLRQQRLGAMLYWTPLAALPFALAGAVWRWRARQHSLATHLQRAWPVLLLALLATIFVAVTVPLQQRVQFDETSLLGTSQNMHHQRLAVMTTASYPSRGELVPVGNMVDKRPTLFPLLASLLHDVRGYDPDHTLVLNVLLLALALAIAGLAVRARGLPAALLAPLLLLAVPLTTVVASSGGFELLAALMFGGLLLAARDVVAGRDEATLAPRLANFLGLGVLFAWSRYESLPALLLVVAIVAFGLRGRLPRSRALLAFVLLLPVLLVPLWPLLLHARDPRFYPEAGGQPLLAFAHGVAHVPTFLVAWLTPLPGQPLPGLVAWLAVAAIAWWLWRGRRNVPLRAFDVLLPVVPVAAVTTLVLFWFYGDVGERTALRLFLPAAWATALLPALLLPNLRARVAIVAVMAAAAFAGWQVRAVARGEAMPVLADAATYEGLARAADRLATDRGHTLWVGTPAQFLITRGHAAVSPKAFLERAADVRALLRQGDVRTIFVVETPRDAALAPVFGKPRDVLYQLPGEVVEQVGGSAPFTVHRLRP
jgi:hypothetical protein